MQSNRVPPKEAPLKTADDAYLRSLEFFYERAYGVEFKAACGELLETERRRLSGE